MGRFHRSSELDAFKLTLDAARADKLAPTQTRHDFQASASPAHLHRGHGGKDGQHQPGRRKHTTHEYFETTGRHASAQHAQHTLQHTPQHNTAERLCEPIVVKISGSKGRHQVPTHCEALVGGVGSSSWRGCPEFSDHDASNLSNAFLLTHTTFAHPRHPTLPFFTTPRST